MRRFQEFIAEQDLSLYEKYGNYLFGEVRGIEDDTEYEREQYDDLLYFLNIGHGPYLSDEQLDMFEELMKYKKEFRDILEPDKYKVLYRGLFVKNSRSWPFDSKSRKEQFLERIHDGILAANIKRGTNWVELPINYTYSATGKVQSWTMSFQHATEFATRGRSTSLPYIIAAKPPRKQMLFNTNFTNMIAHSAEYEIIRVSKKPLKCKIFIHRTDAEYYRAGGRIV